MGKLAMLDLNQPRWRAVIDDDDDDDDDDDAVAAVGSRRMR